MAGEKSVGRLIGWLIFYRIGWRRFVSLTAALAIGWLVAGCFVGAAFWAVPRPSFPPGDPILDDKFLRPERWQSDDPAYVARRVKAEADHAEAMGQYDHGMESHELAMNIAGGIGVTSGLGVAVLLYRLARRRVLADPVSSPTANEAV